MSVTTYEHVRIKPYTVETIEHIKITSKINEHVDVEITAIIPEEEKDNPIYDTSIGTKIEVLSDTEETGVLFIGMVKKVKIKQSQGVYYLYISAGSNTIKMDIKLKSRSFQDKGETYEQIIKNITGEYPQGDVIDTASEGKSTGKFIIQYEETDYRFISRLCSMHNQGLVPYSKVDGIKYFFGLPEGKDRGKLEEYNYSVTKEVTNYHKEKENENTTISHLDKVYYEVECEKFFDIGDTISYNDVKFYIKEYVIEIKNSVVLNTYILTTKEGCSVETFYNDKIIGLSLKGSVIQTSTDEVKLHLNIDESQDVSKAHFFKHTTMYTANGNSGLYWMPELGDTVYAYFPTKKECEGVTQNSIRTQGNAGDKISDPNTKYLRTKYGKEIKLDPKEVLITCVDDESYIKLNEDGGIDIFCTKQIKITTLEDFTVESEKNIYINAKEEINLTCKSSSIKMDGSIFIQGKEVRHN